MKKNPILSKSISSLLFVGALASLPGSPSAYADGTWTGGGTGKNWSDNGNWGGAQPTCGKLTFTTGGTQGDTSVVDQNYNENKLLWTGTETWVLNNSGGFGLSFFDLGGTVAAKLENQSTGSVTINAPITFAGTAGPAWGEINAVNGDVTFGSGGPLTVSGAVVAGIKLFGSGHTTTFNNTVSATGRWFATTGPTATTVVVGGSFTSGELYIMNGSTLRLDSAGTITTSGLRLGGDFGTTLTQDLTKGATFALSAAAGGQSFAGNINSVTGNTSAALLVDSQNTSGTNTLSGSVFLNAPLKFQQAAGGTLTLSGNNTYAGGTTLTAGTLAVGHNNALGTIGLTINGTATLQASVENITLPMRSRSARAAR